MKKLVTLAFAFTALIFTASAQEQREGKGKTERHAGKGKGLMVKGLDLTETQKQQMKASHETFRKKMADLKAQNLSDEEMKARRKELMKEQKAQMKSILTADQRAKLEAQRKGAKGERNKFKAHGKRQDIDRAKLKESLGLTEDQQARMKAHRQSVKSQKEAIKQDQSLSKEAKKEKLKDLKNYSKTQRNAILTPAQIEKLEKLKAERKGTRKVKK